MGRPKKDKPFREDGIYEVKVTIGHTFDGKAIRKSFYSSISKADARAKAEKQKAEQALYEKTGEYISDPSTTTFDKWAVKWLETYKKGTIKDHTYNFTYRVNVEEYLIPYFKSAKLTNIRQIDIQEYFNQARNKKSGEPLAVSTLDKQKMILKSLFDAAIDNDLCFKNPVKNIKYQLVADPVQKRVYSREQADTVIAYSKEHGRYDIVIMLETGVRRSELIGLQWSDIDFEGKTIHIQRSVVQTTDQIVIDKPKTKTSDRFIPISTELADYIKSYQNDNAYVISDDKVEPKSPSTFASQFERFMDKMSKEKGCPALTPHELRHTFGTLLREQGVDIYTIQKVMGHSDISVTAAIYVHNDLDVLREQMKID